MAAHGARLSQLHPLASRCESSLEFFSWGTWNGCTAGSRGTAALPSVPIPACSPRGLRVDARPTALGPSLTIRAPRPERVYRPSRRPLPGATSGVRAQLAPQPLPPSNRRAYMPMGKGGLGRGSASWALGSR